ATSLVSTRRHPRRPPPETLAARRPPGRPTAPNPKRSPGLRAAVMTAPGADLVVADDVEIDAPRAGEVMVQVHHCGVCHSDLHYLDGALRTEVPVVLGHEAAGRVIEVGPD